jgi:glycosyltransferase involved in cell wall biosynthesis
MSAPPATLNVSVVICTYNRCDSLRRTLDRFCRMKVPADLQWELIVVDNNSTDTTRSVCDELAGRLPLRYVFEPRQGQSSARNRGIQEAAGDLVAFTDDDVDVSQDWIAQLHQAAVRHPEAGFFGGRIIPRWERPPPGWLAKHSATLLKGMAMHFDRGDTECLVASGDKPFFGANMAFRKTLLAPGPSFREDIGLSADAATRQDETVFMNELLAQGHKGLYAPAVVVFHRNPPSRMTERYVREWFRGHGISKARMGNVRARGMCCGAPCNAWADLLFNGLKYALTRWTCSSSIWLKAEIKMATARGVVSEYRRKSKLTS